MAVVIKLCLGLKKAVSLIYTVLFGAILAVLLLADGRVDYYARNARLSWPDPVLALAALALLVCGCYFRARRAAGRLPAAAYKARRPAVVLAALGLALFAVQVFISWNIYFLTGWDVKAVREAVEQITGPAGGVLNTWEYDLYPNNIFITALLTAIHRAAEAVHIDPNFAYIVVECMMVSSAAVLVGLTLCEQGGSPAAAYGGFGLSAALFGLSPWITIPYTDGYSILFPILTLYLYGRSKRRKGPVLLWQTAVLLAAVLGGLIKPQCFIVLAAIVILEALDAPRRIHEDWRRYGKTAAAALCSGLIVLACAQGLSLGSQRYTGLRENEQMAMVPMHYVMMGLNTEHDGAYLWEDVKLAQMVPGKENKTALCGNVAKGRLVEMGAGGLARHLLKKTLGNYNDGTFSWSLEGNFYDTLLEPPCGAVSEALRGFYYWDGAYNRWFVNGEQFIWLAVLVAGFAGGLAARPRWREDIELAVYLSLTGLTLFLLIFESRARYLFIYAPLFVLAAVTGAAKITRTIQRALTGAAQRKD